MIRAISAAIVMSLLLLYVWERVDLVRLGYRIQQLQAQHTTLKRQSDALNVKLSALTSPERIARVAIDRLGMRAPRPGQVVLVSLSPERPPGQPPTSPLVRLASNGVDR